MFHIHQSLYHFFFLGNTLHNDATMIHIICILLVICYPLYISIVQTSSVNMLLHAFSSLKNNGKRKNISNSLISSVNDLHNLHNIFSCPHHVDNTIGNSLKDLKIF